MSTSSVSAASEPASPTLEISHRDKAILLDAADELLHGPRPGLSGLQQAIARNKLALVMHGLRSSACTCHPVLDTDAIVELWARSTTTYPDDVDAQAEEYRRLVKESAES